MYKKNLFPMIIMSLVMIFPALVSSNVKAEGRSTGISITIDKGIPPLEPTEPTSPSDSPIFIQNQTVSMNHQEQVNVSGQKSLPHTNASSSLPLVVLGLGLLIVSVICLKKNRKDKEVL